VERDTLGELNVERLPDGDGVWPGARARLEGRELRVLADAGQLPSAGARTVYAAYRETPTRWSATLLA
jgi:hypothetical protein